VVVLEALTQRRVLRKKAAGAWGTCIRGYRADDPLSPKKNSWLFGECQGSG